MTNSERMASPSDISKNEYFEVTGAGKIQLYRNAHCRCGNAIGFAFGVSWGKYGFTGGVIGRAEAKRLAEYILAKVNECTETEEEEHDRLKQEFCARMKRAKQSPPQ